MEGLTPGVLNLLILDAEGKRLAVKYYGEQWPAVADQARFEKNVFPKMLKTSARSEMDVILLENCIVVYKFVADTVFAVTGSLNENELLLATVLGTFVDATSLVFRGQVEKRMILENMDLPLLVMDEIIDNGIILETDAAMVADRVSMRSSDEPSMGELPKIPGITPGVPLNEQAVQQFVANAREHLRNFLRS